MRDTNKRGKKDDGRRAWSGRLANLLGGDGRCCKEEKLAGGKRGGSREL